MEAIRGGAEQAAAGPTRPREEMEDFLRSGPQSPSSLKAFCDAAPRVLDNENDAARTSYAMTLVEQGALGRDTAIAVLCRCWSRKLPFTLHVLDIARELYPLRGSSKETTWGMRLASTAMGLDAVPGRPPHRVDTPEGLAAAVAVVRFLTSFSISQDETIVRTFDGEPEARSGPGIVNPHLDQLVRERPGDVDRIIAYVRERGMHPKRRRDVDELRAWLEMDAAAVADGWL